MNQVILHKRELARWVDMDIKDRLFVITGSAGGLGKAFAVELLKAGAKVCISDVNKVRVRTETVLEIQRRTVVNPFHPTRPFWPPN